jgi:transcriptional regulator with XRE-family HTH domain
MPALKVGTLGEFLRAQRKSAQLSLRQLAEQAGVSNPYLSQIERGLRKPSAEILQQIAKGLRISAEQLYVQAGILDERSEGDLAVESALLADPALTERQKRMLLEIYRSFRAENLHAASEVDRATDESDQPASAASTDSDTAPEPTVAPRKPRSAAKRPAATKRPKPAPETSTTNEGEI